MTTIAEQVRDVKAGAAEQLPSEVVAAFASDQAALAERGVPRGAVAVGDHLAPFALPDVTGHIRTLDEMTADGPAVIVFYRGGWCPQQLLDRAHAGAETCGLRRTLTRLAAQRPVAKPSRHRPIRAVSSQLGSRAPGS